MSRLEMERCQGGGSGTSKEYQVARMLGRGVGRCLIIGHSPSAMAGVGSGVSKIVDVRGAILWYQFSSRRTFIILLRLCFFAAPRVAGGMRGYRISQGLEKKILGSHIVDGGAEPRPFFFHPVSGFNFSFLCRHFFRQFREGFKKSMGIFFHEIKPSFQRKITKISKYKHKKETERSLEVEELNSMSVLHRPDGDEVADTYGNYVSPSDVLQHVKMGSKYDVLCKDGFNYVCQVVSYHSTDEVVLHFPRWDKKYDYKGALSTLYLADEGTHTGDNKSNYYGKLVSRECTKSSSSDQKKERSSGSKSTRFPNTRKYDDDFLARPRWNGSGARSTRLKRNRSTSADEDPSPISGRSNLSNSDKGDEDEDDINSRAEDETEAENKDESNTGNGNAAKQGGLKTDPIGKQQNLEKSYILEGTKVYDFTLPCKLIYHRTTKYSKVIFLTPYYMMCRWWRRRRRRRMLRT